MKRVFIIHGWEGNPEEGWFPWAKKELEKKGFEVNVPSMPDVDGNPEIESRVNFIKELVGTPDESTYTIFTKDDPFVATENASAYREKFGSKIIILESGGHLNDKSGTKELPEVIGAIEEILVQVHVDR
ncbi:MAG: alpha/beta hydrolase [bacterium]|nr:alpha/beta hydrolase [bacterium]